MVHLYLLKEMLLLFLIKHSQLLLVLLLWAHGDTFPFDELTQQLKSIKIDGFVRLARLPAVAQIHYKFERQIAKHTNQSPIE